MPLSERLNTWFSEVILNKTGSQIRQFRGGNEEPGGPPPAPHPVRGPGGSNALPSAGSLQAPATRLLKQSEFKATAGLWDLERASH